MDRQTLVNIESLSRLKNEKLTMANVSHDDPAWTQPRDLPDAEHVSDLWRGHVYTGTNLSK